MRLFNHRVGMGSLFGNGSSPPTNGPQMSRQYSTPNPQMTEWLNSGLRQRATGSSSPLGGILARGMGGLAGGHLGQQFGTLGNGFGTMQGAWQPPNYSGGYGGMFGRGGSYSPGGGTNSYGGMGYRGSLFGGQRSGGYGLFGGYSGGRPIQYF